MKQELNKVIEYIEINLEFEITLTDISEALHYSDSYISRKFNQYVGMSINTYINKRRLSKVAIDLKKTDKSIEYLAHTYGYNTQKYFSNLFKKEFQLTPNQYRKGSLFIELTPKRQIKGEQLMYINDVKELCSTIFQKATNQNELLDIISSIENCELYKVDGSELRLIAYYPVNDTTEINEIKLNVLSGNYSIETIFFTRNDYHTVKGLYKEDESIYVEFIDVTTNKTIKANIFEGVTAEVLIGSSIYEENSLEASETNKSSYDEQMQLHYKNEEFAKKVLECTNDVEVNEQIIKEENLITLRNFGSEYVLIKLHTKPGFYRVDSIYLNMNEKRYFNHTFFGTGVKADSIRLTKEDEHAVVYVDNKKHSFHYILTGEELPSNLGLKFPSGMMGNGGWDFSEEFDI